MADIRHWAFSLCVVMVACGLAGMLLPKTNLEKMFKMAVSVFFLVSILSPFVISAPALHFDIQTYSDEDIQRRAQRLMDTVDAQSEEMIKHDLTKIISDKLEQMGINYTSITIHITSNGQNGTAVPIADIELERILEPQHQSIRRELTETLGFAVRLGYS